MRRHCSESESKWAGGGRSVRRGTTFRGEWGLLFLSPHPSSRESARLQSHAILHRCPDKYLRPVLDFLAPDATPHMATWAPDSECFNVR